MKRSCLSLGRLGATLLLVLVLSNGCVVIDSVTGAFSRLFGDVEEQTPPELMMEGQEYMEQGRYAAASEAFQQIKDRYPYSKFAIKAELLLADAMFLREEYTTAYELYDEFERLHPRNPDIPYAIFRKGECHLAQVSTIDRDQSHTHAAKDEFERLVKRFPDDRYAKIARKKIRKCLIYLAEYELYVGHFYFDMGNYRAAKGRYQYIIENYPDMGQYHEALEYIRVCQEKLAAQEAERQEEIAEEEQERAEEEAAKAAAKAVEEAEKSDKNAGEGS
jgi:outer membrane protein assembly factor BamD